MEKLFNKRAISHLEVILSFVIFIGFLIFMLAIFNPFSSDNSNRIFLDVLERGILDYSDVDVSLITLSIDIEPEVFPNDCFSINYNFTNISVRDKNDAIVQAYSETTPIGGKIYINSIDNFFYIYSSPEFEERLFSGTCPVVPSALYNLGLFRSYKFLANSSLTRLISEYRNNYEGLKQKLEVPLTQEFSFVVKEYSGNVLYDAGRANLGGVKILAREVPVQIVYSDGSFKTAILGIKIW